jgi:uncharacterized protein YxeA
MKIFFFVVAIFCTLFFGLGIYRNANSSTNFNPILNQGVREEIAQIEAQIEELKQKKRGFEGRAIRAENQADRLQFEDQFLLETRRYYQIAEENRKKARIVQEEIDRLEAKKMQLLRGA